MMSDNKVTYHGIDFLLPAQRFNIQFSYVSKKGLPFIREFVLRLIHIAPMEKIHISTYFGLSSRETDEAISDLVERGELTLLDSGRLTLTEKSFGYFYEIGESLQLSAVQDSGASLSFDLATFSCLGNKVSNEKWKGGIPLRIDDEKASRSESIVEKHFQLQFHEIYEKDYLSKSLRQDGKESPAVYTVNSVNKLRHLPLRLTTEFKLDADGRVVEREDFEELNNSEYVHELMAIELSRLAKQNNIMDIFKSMVALGDDDTLKVFDSKTNSISPNYLLDLQKLEENNGLKRTTFLGPIYAKENWELLQRHLAPVLISRINSKADIEKNQFIWIAPADSFWGKSYRFISCISDFLSKASTKEKRIYKPTIFVPVADAGDTRTARQWRNELYQNLNEVVGLVEGFLDGNVEILYLENELVVVIYHLSQPEHFPVSLPVGFVSIDRNTVKNIGRVAIDYIEGNASFDKPNACGLISQIASNQHYS